MSGFEVCPKCATPSKTIHDHVWVRIRDTPIRDNRIVLKIKKRRFLCKGCRKPFTEPVAGIRKGFRTTDRFRRHIMWCADNFANLHDVQKQLDISSWLTHTAYYEQLQAQVKKIQNPWATTIGIDEHAFRRNKKRGHREFATIFVEYSHNKEAMHRLYNIKGKNFAGKVLTRLTDQMALSKIPEVRTLRETLHKWREEILQFFENGLTNGRTEGFNRVGKLIQRNAYGFRNFENYRRRLIYKTS